MIGLHEESQENILKDVMQYPLSLTLLSSFFASSPPPETFQFTTKPPPVPYVPIQILLSEYSKPVPVIAFFDTGAQRSMMNPMVLPSEYWKPHDQFFRAANGQTFKTTLITRQKIGIQFFLDCVVWTHIIGSDLLNKDILIGFDVYHQAQKLQILPTVIKFKRQFRPYTETSNLFSVTNTIPPFLPYTEKFLQFCPESHSHFQHPLPLWKNPQFYISLPFKLNEDINPTKATHMGMSPTDLALARSECLTLLQQGLIEPTTSQWACQAFYVEKRSERIQEKKRLVIDYKPLNHFLQDNKFPLSRISNLKVHIQKAQYYSKFDLKAGFWQLGIQPTERYKTAFCIPNAQYQWTVMPFGLKTAPSQFQKTMIEIFGPILYSSLIYIDDILLFSETAEDHHQLLQQSLAIIQKYGIMLSEKKSTIGRREIEFLSMHFKNGQYTYGPHLTKELDNFPEENLSVKQIQQFLRILNYVREAIPHLSSYTCHLSKMLKKNPPPWGAEQTTVVKKLKELAHNPPPFTIP
ncbi:uncharacterized protein LOC125369846 [Ricinus communis]|uniref:uncharacterized protein LOC125369846 n=1 Tax=Ricinus communis TaxID=3988 RepID=UPI00201AB68B|nr:uncharacterized protein LOC125369846 [Ricinus communis]